MRRRVVFGGPSLLLALALSGTALAQGALTVAYQPPLISVDARDMPLASILREIGAKAGFTVEQRGLDSRPITIAIRDATLDDVLRQLLRSENHTLLYRDQAGQPAGVLDQIVLLGPASAAPAVATAGRHQRPDLGGAPGMVAPVPAQPVPVPSPQAAMVPPSAPPAAAEGSDDAEPTVSDVLRSHAAATLRAAEMAQAAPAVPAPPTVAGAPVAAGNPPVLSPEAQDALAASTRQAQQSLKALVDGLDAATRALQQQQTVPASPQPAASGRQ